MPSMFPTFNSSTVISTPCFIWNRTKLKRGELWTERNRTNQRIHFMRTSKEYEKVIASKIGPKLENKYQNIKYSFQLIK